MVPALTINRLTSKVRKDYSGKEAVIGIMMGRYNVQNIQDAIDESYQYWHLNSDKGFDIYWAGYGKYWGKRTENQIILECANTADGVYFDMKSFIDFKTAIQKTKKIVCKDTFQLILCNVRNGNIKYDENIVIDLEENLNGSTASLREIMENVINLCKVKSNVAEVNRVIISQDIWKKVRGISVSEIISLASSIAGIKTGLV